MSAINPAWEQYQRINLEGGEGYNPYPKYLGNSDEPMWSQLYETMHTALVRLNATPLADTAAYQTAQANYEAAEAAYSAEYARAHAAGEV